MQTSTVFIGFMIMQISIITFIGFMMQMDIRDTILAIVFFLMISVSVYLMTGGM